MKHKKAILAIMVIFLVIGITFLIAGDTPRNETEQTVSREVKPTPLVIVTSDEKVGNISIYADEKLIYNYEGPINLQKKDGIYEIKIETFSCSCFEKPPTEE